MPENPEIENQELAELQKWAQQVHDALDGRPLPPCPDDAPARIKALLAERDAEKAEHRDTAFWLAEANAETEKLAGRVAVLEAALREALDLLEDTAHGKVHDGQQAWQDAFGRIHDAAGKPQRGTEPRPWEPAVLAGGDAAPQTIFCHICHRPRNEPGELFCSYPHPLGDAAAESKPPSSMRNVKLVVRKREEGDNVITIDGVSASYCLLEVTAPDVAVEILHHDYEPPKGYKVGDKYP